MDNTKCLITKEIIKKIAFDDSFKESLDNDGVVDGYVSKFAAKPEMGFNFGYLIYIPISLITNPVLIIEGPSVSEVGPSEKACEIVYSKAVFELSTGGFSHFLAKKVQCPVIMPLFPRPEDKENNTNIFTHALSSKSMSISENPIARIDLQLIAMFRDIKNRFSNANIELYNRFIVKGFSSGGVFAHRFTILHPNYVLAAVGGGCMHSFTLPLKTFNGETLLWPNGIGNMDQFSNINPCFEEYKSVKQLFYLGDMDYNDSVPYHDSYTEEERQQVYRLFGKIGIPDRWNMYQKLIKELKLNNIVCITQHGIDHKPGNEIREYIVNYLQDIITQI